MINTPDMGVNKKGGDDYELKEVSTSDGGKSLERVRNVDDGRFLFVFAQLLS